MNPMMFPWIPAGPKPLTGFEEWEMADLGFYFYMNLLSCPSTSYTDPPPPFSFLLHQNILFLDTGCKSLLLSSKGFWRRKPFPNIRDISKNKMTLVTTNHNISNLELLFSCEQESYHLVWQIFVWILSDITGQSGVGKTNLRCHLYSQHLFLSNTRRMFYNEWWLLQIWYYISILYHYPYFFEWHVKNIYI